MFIFCIERTKKSRVLHEEYVPKSVSSVILIRHRTGSRHQRLTPSFKPNLTPMKKILMDRLPKDAP